MNWISYLLFRGFVVIFSLIPFKVMYKISDFVAWLLRVVIKYRVHVVRSNIEMCFPERSWEEIDEIVKACYLNLADITLESIKGNSMSASDFNERYTYKNPELINAYADKNIDLILISSHYTNWEWMSLAWKLKLKAHSYALYKPLSNKVLDNYLKKIRERMGMPMIDMNGAGATIKEIRSAYSPNAFIFIADQSPGSIHKAHWVDFFNIKTAFIHGPSQFTRVLNLPLIFYYTKRLKRGYYEVEFTLLAEEPKQLGALEITQIFAKKLEEVIRSYPPDWLWSHKRWKHKYPLSKSEQ